MRKNLFQHTVKLLPLNVKNTDKESFREALNEIPYLLYEAEQLSDGTKIVINKPGGKRNFGRLSQNDFMVFIYNPTENSLWLISHDEIMEDLLEKKENDADEAKKLVCGLCAVCNGEEPADVITKFQFQNRVGLSAETILNVYKWIWGQEDCNYPQGKGRWLSMDAILEKFNMTIEDCHF